MSEVTSEGIFQALYAESPERRRVALERLKTACDSILAQKAVATLTDVEKAIKSRFGIACGPRAQSISNERNRELGMYHYVEARNREQRGLNPHLFKKGAQVSLDRAVDDIEDMDLRNLLRDIIASRDVAVKSLARAKFVLKTVKPGVDIEAILSGTASTDTTSHIEPKIIEEAYAAITVLNDDEILRSCGLMNDGGAIRRRGGTGDELLSAGAMTALRILLSGLRSR